MADRERTTRPAALGTAAVLGLAILICGVCGASTRSAKTMNCIGISGDTNRTMSFAAGELMKYLKEMTHQEYVVAANPGDKCLIRLGIDEALHHDGYRIRTSDGEIRIDGGSPRGCMYGAYAFLHKLGCRWSLPGKDYELVPRMNSIDWTHGDIRSEPSMRRRGMVVNLGEPNPFIVTYIDFMAKNGFNYLFVDVSALPDDLRKQMASAMADRDMGFEHGGHLLPGLLPRDLFDQHPEYFRMEDGKRVRDLNLCTSSEGAADITAKNAQEPLSVLQQFARPETLHLWADDLGSGGWCSCDQCKEMTATDQTIKALNDIAERTDLGETMLGFCAYHASVYPPKDVTPSDHVRLMFAPRERCYRHALDGCEANKRYLEYLKGLIVSTPKEPEVFEYYHDCILLRYMSVPLHKTIARDARIYKEAGIDGVASLSFGLFSDWAYGSNTYTLARALWRGEGAPEDIEEYCEDVYGPAARHMKTYFDLLSEVTSLAMETCGYADGVDLRVPPTQSFAKKHLDELAPLVTDQHLDEIEAHLRKALNVGKEPYRSRVHDQLSIWEFTRHEAKILHEQLIVGSRIIPLLEGKGSDAERKDTIARLERLISEINAGTEMMCSAPERLRGYWGSPRPGSAIEERNYLYQPTLKAWLDALKAKSGN